MVNCCWCYGGYVKGLQLYNLFPRYYDHCLQWAEMFPHIKGLGFNSVYINPFHYAGFSGSLYAPKDYYSLNPMCYDPLSSVEPMAQLKEVLEQAHAQGLKVFMDLIINHTSKDHPFVKEFPFWYVYDAQGQIVSPGAWENGQWVSWGDLAQIDNSYSSDKENLWQYWEDLILFYSDLGFDGFRADAAYQVPPALWERLIKKGKEFNPNILFLAESLGCTLPQSLTLVQVGFDYLFNSAKWWDFSQNWFFEQYNAINIPTIAFPESHDTQRAAQEYSDSLPKLRRLIGFTGLISASWMIVTGTEWGWKRKTDTVHTFPCDKELIHINLSSYISSINALRSKCLLLESEGILQYRDHEHTADILCFVKNIPYGKDGLFYVINKTDKQKKFTTLLLADFLNAESVKLLFSSENDSNFDEKSISLQPYEFKLFIFRKLC